VRQQWTEQNGKIIKRFKWGRMVQKCQDKYRKDFANHIYLSLKIYFLNSSIIL